MVKLNDEKTLNKWTKFAEAILLMAMGLMFFIIAWISDEDLGYGLSYAVGVVCTIYGVIVIVTEYLVRRRPITNKSIGGIVFIGLAVALFVNPEAINSLLSEMLSTITFVISALLIIFSIDLLIRNHKMQKEIDAESSKDDNIDLNMISKTRAAKKRNTHVVIGFFILAAVLIAGGVIFEYYYYAVGIRTIDQYLLMLYGIGIFIFGIVLFISYYNTNKKIKQAMLDEEIRKKAAQKQVESVKEDTVKVISLSQLERQNRKRKSTEKKTAEMNKPVANERGEISINDLPAAEEEKTEEVVEKPVTKKKSSSKKKKSSETTDK